MSEQKQEQAVDRLKNEYAEVNQNLRHYSGLRFAIFSVFFAVMAGTAGLSFSSGQFTPFAATAAKVGGLIATLVFWNFEERTLRLLTHFGKVAAELERSLGYTQLSTRPPAKFPVLDSGIITRLFFLILTAFWVYTLIANP